jgi:hypothetical protein
MEVNTMHYYLTIAKNGVELCRRKEYDDYYLAMDACAKYYSPKIRRSILSFTAETVNGHFARSYAAINLPEHIEDPLDDKIKKLRYETAVKNSNKFEYDGSYFFSSLKVILA